MKYIIMMLIWCILPYQAFAKVNIFACEPEWAALAQVIAGDLAEVTSATTADQDPHHIRAKPSLMAAIRQADIVICSGAGLEVGWLPLLLQKAKPEVQHGQVGNIMVAENVKRLGIPEQLDRSLGDIHPEGNPHVHLNPQNILIAADILYQRLLHIDDVNRIAYEENTKIFQQKWQSSMQRWQKDQVALQGMPIVVHHTNWLYLEEWLGLKRVASLEPKAGIPPTVKHLEMVQHEVKQQPIRAIIRAAHENADASEWLSEKTGVVALSLPYTVGGAEGVESLEALFDTIIALLLKVH